jgi:hypothetical protein
MPVDTRHEDYTAHEGRWRRVRDVLEGEHAVKQAGEKYLPKLKRQNMEDYAAYQNRAPFFDASSRTLDGLVGAIFRKDPSVTMPQSREAVLENVTQRGTSFDAFAKETTAEVISLGRYGILVDVSDTGGEPYLAGYAAEAILNWRVSIIDRQPVLSLVVLRETKSEPKSDDPFGTTEIEQFRVLQLGRLDGAKGALVYLQSLWERRPNAAGSDDLLLTVKPFAPTRRGQPLDFVPFQFIAPRQLGPEVAKSPIDGLVNTNLAIYRTSVDLKHGAHFTALPTPVIAGSIIGGSDGDTTLSIGGPTAWQLEKDAKWGMLEYTGQGLGALRDIRDDEKKDMAVLGARLLEDQKSGVEAAATISLRHRGENSLLASIADTTGRGLQQALRWLVEWAGAESSDDVTVELNRDFFEKAMTPKDTIELVAGWQQGGFGGDVLYHNLREGERLPPGMTKEEWIKDIEDNGPSAAMFGGDDGPAA